MLGVIRTAQQGRNARAWSSQPAPPLAQLAQVTGGKGDGQSSLARMDRSWGALTITVIPFGFSLSDLYGSHDS